MSIYIYLNVYVDICRYMYIWIYIYIYICIYIYTIVYIYICKYTLTTSYVYLKKENYIYICSYIPSTNILIDNPRQINYKGDIFRRESSAPGDQRLWSLLLFANGSGQILLRLADILLWPRPSKYVNIVDLKKQQLIRYMITLRTWSHAFFGAILNLNKHILEFASKTYIT